MCPATSTKKKKVSFFERVQIREIKVISSCEWSEKDDDDDILLDEDKFEYQMDLYQDVGDYHEDLNTEPRKSQCGKYSGKSRGNNNRKTLDFSGKIYSSSLQANAQIDRIDSKFLLLPSHKADRWSTSSSTKDRKRTIPHYDQPEFDQFLSETIDSMEFTEGRVNRIREKSPYNDKNRYTAGSHSYGGSAQRLRRTSSTESLNRSVSKPPSGTSSSSNWKRITSAPTLMRRKPKSSKNRPSLADSRNATFCSTNPPLLPTRWGSRRKNIFLRDRVNDKSKNLKRLSDSSGSNHTFATSSTSTTNNCSDLDKDEADDIDNSEEFSEAFIIESNEPSPVKTTKLFVPESPKNRRNLLQRSMGSLRSLTSKSPLSRSKKGRKDGPPRRPVRLSSVDKLQLEDISAPF